MDEKSRNLLIIFCISIVVLVGVLTPILHNILRKGYDKNFIKLLLGLTIFTIHIILTFSMVEMFRSSYNMIEIILNTILYSLGYFSLSILCIEVHEKNK